jgi:RNA polymerase sigma-70 factor (ECF subfamily)
MDEQANDAGWWLREHGPKLVLLARQYVGCHADAEDVVQEAFVRFWRERAAAREPVAYAYRCVRNAALNRQRAERRRRRHEHGAAVERMFAGDNGEVADAGEDVSRALQSLPEEQREVVVLKIWGGLTFETIGRVLDIPQGTAQSRYRYAIQSLRKALGEC